MTIAVESSKLKASLARHLHLVREGKSVVVLDRGRPVAILSPCSGADATTVHLAQLAARGLLTLATGTKMRRAPRTLPRVDLSSAVIEDREDRV